MYVLTLTHEYIVVYSYRSTYLYLVSRVVQVVVDNSITEAVPGNLDVE